MTVALFTLAALAAVGDWVAVARRYFRLEYLLKPLTLVLLIAAASSADIPVAKGWVLGALVFGLIGDVALMLSKGAVGTVDAAFLLGLVAFLVGHIWYLGAFARHGVHGVGLIIGAVLVVASAGLTLPRILIRANGIGGPELATVVGTYGALLGAMAVLAVGTGSVATAVGGLLFLASDTVIAWQRFVTRLPHGALLVIVTYHLGQLLIVLGLIRH